MINVVGGKQPSHGIKLFVIPPINSRITTMHVVINCMIKLLEIYSEASTFDVKRIITNSPNKIL